MKYKLWIVWRGPSQIANVEEFIEKFLLGGVMATFYGTEPDSLTLPVDSFVLETDVEVLNKGRVINIRRQIEAEVPTVIWETPNAD